MRKSMLRISPIALAVVSALAVNAHAADPGLAPWLKQIGETNAILSAANWGKGQVIGVVDTGIVSTNPVFAAGQVSNSLSSCAAVSFKCTNGALDDNGHGTSVASIAAANKPTAYLYSYPGYTVNANSYIGVAPNANIVAEKVLNRNGSGTSADVANGINKAVAAGSTVINLSLTYIPSPDIVAAVNNAAAKGVFIVWAGGNSSAALVNNANSLGFTPTAINHILLVGALDTTATKLASFSNRPGNGAFVSTAGTRTSYAARWVDAPGVNILAPGVMYGPNAMALWSGTSMSAPIVSGSLALLESAWPILKTNGTAANLLLATASDLGTKGVDSTYGAGLINLSAAFQPYGTLTVTQANGRTVAVTSMTGSMITGGALGNLSTVQAKLANYTALDGYLRNYTVNLSGLIRTKPTGATVNPLPSNPNTGVVVRRLDDGGEFAAWQVPVSNLSDRMGVFWNDDGYQNANIGYMAYTNGAGSTVAMGYGVPAKYSFSRALYGDANLSLLGGELGVGNLSDLAQGGYHLAYGTRLDNQTRMAVSLTQTPTGYFAGNPAFGQMTGASSAVNLNVGFTHKLSERWTAGVTLGQLNEKSTLLGTGYAPDSALSLGDNHTNSYGFSLGYAIDADHSLLAEAGIAYTKGSSGSGLLAETSAIQSRSYGATYLSKRLWNDSDRLTVSVKQPLRVVSGRAGVVATNIDELGIAHYSTDMVSLVPTGREVDLKVAYDTPIGKRQALSLQVVGRKDVDNIAGNRDTSIGMIWSARF